jgi:hypothetical protein
VSTARAAVQGVVAEPAGQPVGVAAAMHQVGVRAAVEPVVAGPAQQGVVALAALGVERVRREQAAGVEQVGVVAALVVDGVLREAAAAEVARDHHAAAVDHHVLDVLDGEVGLSVAVEVEQQGAAVAAPHDAGFASGGQFGNGDLEHVDAGAAVHEGGRVRVAEDDLDLPVVGVADLDQAEGGRQAGEGAGSEGGDQLALEGDQRAERAVAGRAVQVHLQQGVLAVLDQPEVAGGERIVASVPARQHRGQVAGQVEPVLAGSEVADHDGGVAWEANAPSRIRVSTPEPRLTVDTPLTAPRLIRSSPAPPFTVSSPTPPALITSAPSSPSSRSAPFPPAITSAPAPARIWSPPAPPVRVSAKRLPVMIARSMEVRVSVRRGRR